MEKETILSICGFILCFIVASFVALEAGWKMSQLQKTETVTPCNYDHQLLLEKIQADQKKNAIRIRDLELQLTEHKAKCKIN